MVPATGLEPVRCYSLEPESSASANSATRALWPCNLPRMVTRSRPYRYTNQALIRKHPIAALHNCFNSFLVQPSGHETTTPPLFPGAFTRLDSPPHRLPEHDVFGIRKSRCLQTGFAEETRRGRARRGEGRATGIQGRAHASEGNDGF